VVLGTFFFDDGKDSLEFIAIEIDALEK